MKDVFEIPNKYPNLKAYSNQCKEYFMQIIAKTQEGRVSHSQYDKYAKKINEWFNEAIRKEGLAPEELLLEIIGEGGVEMSIAEIVKEIIADLSDVINVKMSHDLRDDLDMTDGDIEYLAEEIALEFEIDEPTEADVEDWETVKDVVAYVKANVGSLDE